MSSSSRTQDQPEPGAPGQAAPGDAETARAVVLLRRACNGDRGAFGQLVVLYQDRLFNAVLRLVGDRDEAAELTQEAFTRGLESLDAFRGESGPYTWLFRIAINLSISRLRKLQRHRVFSLDRPSNGQTSQGSARYDDQAAGLLDRSRPVPQEPPAAMEQRERAEQVLAAMGRIDPEYRAVLIMRDIEGFDYQQMANVLSLPLGTLKSRLFRARTALRDELKAYMGR
jgi:RNA polymerase sigma-70 factor (ECF subfamily)